MPKKMVLKEAHTTYSLNIETSQLTQSPIVLEHEGKPIAALISLADYQRFVKHFSITLNGKDLTFEMRDP